LTANADRPTKTRWSSESDLIFTSSRKLITSTKPNWNIFRKWPVNLVRPIQAPVGIAQDRLLKIDPRDVFLGKSEAGFF
jgi:hypothetical protein